MVADHHERTATEIPGAFEVAGERGEIVQSDRGGLARERRKDRSSECVRARGGGDSAIDQARADATRADGHERGFDRTSARNERLEPFDKRDERTISIGAAAARRAVHPEGRRDEARITRSDYGEWTDRCDQASRGRKRRCRDRGDDLRARELALGPAEATPREFRCDENRAHGMRQPRSGREPRQTFTDDRARAAREDRREQRDRREDGAGEAHRRTTSIARRLAMRPIASRARAIGISTNRPSGCPRVVASDGTVSARYRAIAGTTSASSRT